MVSEPLEGGIRWLCKGKRFCHRGKIVWIPNQLGPISVNKGILNDYTYIFYIYSIHNIFIIHSPFEICFYMLPSCLGPAVQHGGNRKSVTTQMSSRPEIVGRYLMEYIYNIHSRRILTVCCIWYEIPEILLFRNGWMKKVTLNFGVYLYEGFPLAHPNTWKLECYQQ